MDRGQAHTLEAFTAALIVLSSVLFAMQVTAVTPLTASTSSQHIENQQGSVAEGALAAAQERDILKPTLLYWNATAGGFHDAGRRGAYTSGGPPTPFGASLDETFLDRGIAYDVNVYYLRESGERRRQAVVNLGGPSDNAVAATATVTLYDDDPVYDADWTENGTLADRSFYASDIGDGGVYNVVVVEVVVWRM